MISNAHNIPEAWLSRLGGRDASGWLYAFVESPKKAVSDLLWDSFFFGPLNPVEGGQLLEGWLDLLGNREEFAARLDAELVGWVVENWGRFDNHSAKTLAFAWSRLCGIVEFSAKLPGESRLINSAKALRARFDERQRFLGSFSSAPAADPLGLYLAVVAEFQGEDRSLAPFWHRMCELPDDVPFYHARHALLGLRRLKAADPAENGTLRAEVVIGLLRLARSFERLTIERGLPSDIAKTTFSRLAAQTAAAYPDSPYWREHGLTEAQNLPSQARAWVRKAIPTLAVAMRLEESHGGTRRPPRVLEPKPEWTGRAREIGPGLGQGDLSYVQKAEELLREERHFAEMTGNSYDLVHSSRHFATRILNYRPDLAERWATEAHRWAPDDPYSWTILRNVFFHRDQARALRIAWIAWKRFPENVFSLTGLAAVLKAYERYDEAEEIYREAVERFPDNAVSYTGLGEVLRAVGRYDEAESVYRRAIEKLPDVVVRTALADMLQNLGRLDDAEKEHRQSIDSGYADFTTYIKLARLMLRKREAGRAEALGFVNKALELRPNDSNAKRLKRSIENAGSTGDLNEIWNRERKTHHEAKPDELSLKQGAASKIAPTNVADTKIADAARPTQTDSFTVPALVAEAYFYRMWAKKAEGETAQQRRQIASALLTEAEQHSPQDSLVITERVALSVDQGNETAAYENLNAKLANHRGAASLLVLKARLEREQARKDERRLNDSTLAELWKAPHLLHNLKPALTPLFYFQKGLAALALLDGDVRLQTAASELSNFRQILSHRAAVERREREASRDKGAEETLRFHEWLQRQVERQLFSGLAETEDTEVQPGDIPVLESLWANERMLIERIEDVSADHITFGAI